METQEVASEPAALEMSDLMKQMPPKIETSRLVLIKMTDTSENGLQLQWFHKLWTDDAATSWSIHGKCKDLAASRAWMLEHMTEWDRITYFVCTKPGSTATTTTNEQESKPRDENLIGSIGLRTHDEIMHAPLPPPISPAQTTPSSPQTSPNFNFRVLGYSFFESTWGRGYATESLSALLSSYASTIKASQKKDAEAWNYVEAAVSHENPASMRIMEKLGFAQVGWKSYADPAWLGWPGRWVYGGHWVYGMYV